MLDRANRNPSKVSGLGKLSGSFCSALIGNPKREPIGRVRPSENRNGLSRMVREHVTMFDDGLDT